MGRKNQQQALQAGPPDELLPSEKIAKVESINGNNIYTVSFADSQDTNAAPSATGKILSLVELPPKFRNSIWIRRGGFVLVNCAAFDGRDNKLAGEIVNVIHDEKSWMKMNYWPVLFRKQKDHTNGIEVGDDDEELQGGNLNKRREYESESSD